MLFLALTAFLTTAAMSAPVDDLPVIDQVLVDEVNSHNKWTAKLNYHFRNMTRREARRLCGTFLSENENTAIAGKETHISGSSIPDEFDARTKWPGAIHPIRNQKACGSCWAFAATEALSDRFAIQTNGAVDVVLSPQDLVSCDDLDGNQGCLGGFPLKAWRYMEKTGIVVDSCYPYSSGGGTTGQCHLTGSAECPNGSGTDKFYKAASAYNVPFNVSAIQTEIMTNGPIEAAFKVYQDFYAYHKGVYEHVSGGFVGGHAVKTLGWGVEDSVPYWLVANSWGATWADYEGYFKIKRGVNECQFESQMVAGLADVNSV
eukprot:m.307121 g.307121  ORF g.307121 m.307121 type:complete len:317 (+) comp41934_c0_seq1:35-985(+)